jgi:Uma2 family endonuclease
MAIQPILTPEIIAPAPRLVTGEKFGGMHDAGRAELVKGVIVEMPPPGYMHGFIEGNFHRVLSAFVRRHRLGYVLVGESGLYTRRNPDTVRGVDVAFISQARMAQVQSKTYLDVAPELIVEVLSPGDSWSGVKDKLAEYFAVGVLLVWVANPQRRQLHVYRSLTDAEILTAADELSGGDVLPGFRVAVAELFETP